MADGVKEEEEEEEEEEERTWGSVLYSHNLWLGEDRVWSSEVP